MSGSKSSTASTDLGAIYGLGVIGAWVYFWQEADGFWWYVLAILEGPFWPAFLVHEALGAVLG